MAKNNIKKIKKLVVVHLFKLVINLVVPGYFHQWIFTVLLFLESGTAQSRLCNCTKQSLDTALSVVFSRQIKTWFSMNIKKIKLLVPGYFHQWIFTVLLFLESGTTQSRLCNCTKQSLDTALSVVFSRHIKTGYSMAKLAWRACGGPPFTHK